MAIPIWVPNTETVVPVGLRYTDANGDLVTKLFPLDYLILVGQDLAIISGTTNQLLAAWAYQANQINIINAAIATIPPEYNTPEINPLCLGLSGTTVAIDVVLEAMVTAWCSYLNVTGGTTALATAITQQCPNLNSSPSFGVPGTSMSAITGWKNAPTTIADTLTNLWLTSCDSRSGIQNVLAAVTPTCAQVIVDYQVVLTSSDTVFNFYFNGYTFIPTGFVDNGSSIRITDLAGNIYIQTVDLPDQSLIPGPVSIAISGTTLQLNSTYTITVISNVENTNLGLTCEKTVIKNVNTNTVTPNECCPDIGTFSYSYISGTTVQNSYSFVSGLSYTPRFVGMTPRNQFTQKHLSGFNPYLDYVPGGATLMFAETTQPLIESGTFLYDYISYK